jgi:DNA-binding response OmpR family regulator
MRVLVVEDDSALGGYLQKGLKLEGYDVEVVSDGDAAVERAQEHMPDLMLLDLSLPRRDGVQVLEALSGCLRQTAVLILTGRRDLEERIRCLNMGADDCLLKPFSFHELAARCRALLRRREMTADPVLRFSDVEMDRMERKVTRCGREVDLTAKEFALLEFLMKHAGECVERGTLLQSVWKIRPDAGTNVVDVYINYLRRKLAVDSVDGSVAGALIETVRGYGYRLHDAVQEAQMELLPRKLPQSVSDGTAALWLAEAN